MSLQTLIAREARARGIDPLAALAVASVEGGFGGAIGDHGTSFGPFQLHQGGALPHGRGSNWANSPAGIAYALDQIARVARGQHGRQAIASIVSRFERPAAPGAEIAKASSRYGRIGGANAGANSPAPRPTAGLANSPDRRDFVLSLIQGLGQDHPDVGALSQLLASRPTEADQARATVRKHFGPPEATSEQTTQDARVVASAKKWLGTPYVYGGSSRTGVDCSALLQRVWADGGVSIPRTTYDQWKKGTAVGKGQLRAGDAVFFRGSDPRGGLPGHVGIYIGGGKFIEAPHTGARVRVSTLAGRTDYQGARRYG